MNKFIRNGKIATGLATILGLTTTLGAIGKVEYDSRSTKIGTAYRDVSTETTIGLIGFGIMFVGSMGYLTLGQSEYNKKRNKYGSNQ